MNDHPTIWSRLQLDTQLANTIAWLPHLLAAAVTLFLIWLLHRALSRGLIFIMRRSHVDQTAVVFVTNVVQYAFFIVAVITALSQVGVDVTGILASLGVVGLTIGFAAQDTLSNIISGLFIFWDRPFVLDDLVEIDGSYGRVQAITLRSTRVVTADGRMLAIPNSTVVNTKVASYTNFPHLRMDIGVTVGVDEDLARCRQLLLALPTPEEGYMADPAPAVVVTALNDYNVALELEAWLVDERQHLAARARLRERVFETLRKAGVDMPFETLALAPIALQTPLQSA